LEQPCAFNGIESFGGFILSGFTTLFSIGLRGREKKGERREGEGKGNDNLASS